MSTLTALQRAADGLLTQNRDQTLETFIQTLRSQGASADTLVRELHTETGGLIAVSRGTMYAWIRQFEVAA